ncbi:MAG: Ni/Fe hydrogenase subunit alpha [Asgard group archaeon]|nr:Ni/Fe hydrogenase subunit alpha [Asgard group archaeon]
MTQTQSRKITLEPISRLEGKARITFEVDESNNELSKAEFNVLEFRAFEKFLEGRMAREIPRITPRICGICPVSHHLAAAKATDMLARSIIPERAKLHRELMHMGQFIHSHSLHIYFLAMPDFVDGFKAESNDFRLLLEKDPSLVKKVIRIRSFGQKIIQVVGGKAIHPVTAIPGGISKPISAVDQQNLLQEANELVPITKEVLLAGWKLLDNVPDELKSYETLTTHNMALLNPMNEIELYDGESIIVDTNGNKKANFLGDGYENEIAEQSYPYSWTKFPYLRGETDPEAAILQVGPLARQKIYDTIPTEHASEMLSTFREQFGRYTTENYATHHARILETMYSLEKSINILEDPNLMADKPYRVRTPIRKANGVGIIEAPRGTLIHAYDTNDGGRITRSNIIVSNTFNNPAINLALFKVAKQQLDPSKNISDETLRHVESTVRIFDPCLTCSSHSLNNFKVVIQNQRGDILQQTI